jgi:hypothetical protein
VEESESSKEYFLYSSALDSKKKESGALLAVLDDVPDEEPP